MPTGFLKIALLASVALAGPAVAEQLDKIDLPPQVQRIDGVLAPVSGEIFRTLDAFRDSNWKPVLHPELARVPTAGNPPQIALSLGLVIAEGFLAAAAEDAPELRDVGDAALKLARALGVEKSVVSRESSIVERARRKDWAAVREEWSGVNADLKKAMIEIKSEPLAHFISLGGWLRGMEALATLVSQHYSVEEAQLLHQPVMLDYFETQLSKMDEKLKAYPAVVDMQKGIIRFKPLIGSEKQTPVSIDDVKQIREMAAGLIKPLHTK
ncbi:MAG: hypothetical protein JWL59_4949 [Chthoniobacteraceae bacterium]|nr:hypothetical protein [Chthoniobacteraceae bacterium]